MGLRQNIEPVSTTGSGVRAQIAQRANVGKPAPPLDPAAAARIAELEAQVAALQAKLGPYETGPILFTYMDISPADARELLGKNDHNRALSEAAATRYAGDMPHDWALTHQGIAVGPDGELVDGQTRLHAIIKANVTVRMVLAIYRDAKMAEEARQKVDLGRARRGGDVFEIGGVVERGDGKRIFSIASAVAWIDGTQPWGGWTPAAIKAVYAREKRGIDFAADLPPKLFQAPVAGAFAFAHPGAPVEVAAFAALVRDKVGIRPDSAAHLYLQAIDAGRFGGRSGKGERQETSLLVLRLIQAHVTGEQMGKLQISTKGREFFAAKRAAMGLLSTGALAPAL